MGTFPSVVCFAAWYGRTSEQQSYKGSCSLHVSAHYLHTACQRYTTVPPFNSGANAAQCRQCQCSVSTVLALMLAVVALKQPTIMCLTRDEWSYFQLLLLLGLSELRIADPLLKKNISFLAVNLPGIPRTPY